MICEGYWKSGDKLPPQRELAHALDVGMSSIREALQSLQNMGIIEIRHGDGAYVIETPTNEMYSRMVSVSLQMGKTDLEMLFEARGIIETGFAYFAAERATDDQISELFEILEQERAAILAQDQEETHRMDIAFHKKIAEIAVNDFLEQIVESLFTALSDVLQVLPHTMEGWRWHYNVAVEIRNRNPMRASEAMRTLVFASGARLLPYFKNNGSYLL
jgi:GntR family transcriptional repressor for pyruvate dehydrogenase complex